MRVVGVRTGQRHQAGLALGDLVVAGAAALGTVVPEAGDRQDDEPRVELVQPLDREAEPVEHAGAEVLHEHVGAADEAVEHLAPGRRLEVEADRLLVAVGATGSTSTRGSPSGRRRTAAPSRGCRRRGRATRP